MKYLLIVGFSCDVYRQEPLARIIIARQLIDEFYITKHSDSLTALREKITGNWQTGSSVDIDKNVLKNFPPLRFYEIEIDETVDKLHLQIQIKNDDSNYSNGFITTSTLLKLQICYFFPLDQKLLSRLELIKQKNQLTENYAWYCSPKNRIFDLLANGLYWKGENGQVMDNTNTFILAAYNIGGNGDFFCELTKKYSMFIPKLIRPCRHSFNPKVTNYLLDKYYQHANQRNTD
jgi:hypothetical protein